MRTYRVGIVGLGRIASLYESDRKARRYYPALTHAGSYRKHPRTRVVCGCDLDAGRRRAFGKRWRVDALYRDFRKMLRERAVDILSVCTGPDSHLDIVRAAAGAVPLIFCEKPMGRGFAEAGKIESLCRRRGTRLAVNLYRLFDPAHREIGRRIRRGELGRIQRVNCFYGKGLRNQGTHLIGLLLHYFGSVRSARTLALRPLGDSPEPTADLELSFSQGFPALLQGCDFRSYRIFELDVLGSKGRFTLDQEGFGFRFSRAEPNRAEAGAKELVRRRSPVQATVGRALYFAVDNLVRSLDRGTEPWSPGRDYLAVEAVIDAALRSAAKSGRRISPRRSR